MKVRIEKTITIKPIYEGNNIPFSASPYIPLSVFDKVTFHTHEAIIYAYRPPTPSNANIELGLKKALAEYREWAGRLGENEKGDAVIFLNDKGVKLVEASADSKLDSVMPLKPSSALLSLHPSLKDVEELVQVQLTRFSCGSLVVGFTTHHSVADGQSTSNFLVAWGKATRGVDMGPLPLHDRTIFSPRKPPIFDFEHRGVEFKSKKAVKHLPIDDNVDNYFADDFVVQKVHFTLDFLSKLKAKASPSPSPTLNGNIDIKPYSTFESLVTHLWRTITKARGLSGFITTHLRISVNGRTRMAPRIPNEYFGNMVLWAFPSCKVKDLVRESLPYAAKLIHDAIAKVNDSYFKSFVDFATHKAEKEEEQLVPTAQMDMSFLCPNLEVDSWLRIPFYELDFGGGRPYMFMPSSLPIEGMLFLLPSPIGDGSIEAFISLFQDNMATFEQIVYSLD